MVLSLVSRSNQNGSSKSNTAPLLTEAIVTDRNSYKNTSVTLLKLKLKFEQKLFENQKKKVSKQKLFNLFLRKTFIQIMYVYLVRNIKT